LTIIPYSSSFYLSSFEILGSAVILFPEMVENRQKYEQCNGVSIDIERKTEIELKMV
jgi:hypothetical protein